MQNDTKKSCLSRLSRVEGQTFRLPTEDLEKTFNKEATAAGLDGLKGHRLVGGMRASIYNAFPEAGIDALTGFMRDHLAATFDELSATLDVRCVVLTGAGERHFCTGAGLGGHSRHGHHTDTEPLSGVA